MLDSTTAEQVYSPEKGQMLNAKFVSLHLMCRAQSAVKITKTEKPRTIFKQSKARGNSKSSFFLTGYLTKTKKKNTDFPNTFLQMRGEHMKPCWPSRLVLENTSNASLQRRKTSPRSVPDITLNNMFVRLQ